MASVSETFCRDFGVSLAVLLLEMKATLEDFEDQLQSSGQAEPELEGVSG
jgi:hypothetical protein